MNHGRMLPRKVAYEARPHPQGVVLEVGAVRLLLRPPQAIDLANTIVDIIESRETKESPE